MNKEETREVRCADCMRVIERDKPHTCKQQIRTNRKREKR